MELVELPQAALHSVVVLIMVLLVVAQAVAQQTAMLMEASVVTLLVAADLAPVEVALTLAALEMPLPTAELEVHQLQWIQVVTPGTVVRVVLAAAMVILVPMAVAAAAMAIVMQTEAVLVMRVQAVAVLEEALVVAETEELVVVALHCCFYLSIFLVLLSPRWVPVVLVPTAVVVVQAVTGQVLAEAAEALAPVAPVVMEPEARVVLQVMEVLAE